MSRSSLSKVRGVVVDGLAVERHKAQLTTRMYHDHALIVEHLLARAALAVGIGLLQVLEGFLVVAASTELVAHLEPVGVEGGTISRDEGRLWHSVVRWHCRHAAARGLELYEKLERGAALRIRGIDVGAGAQQAEDALGPPIHRGDQEGSEPSRGVDPVRVCALAQQFVEACQLTVRGGVVEAC